MFLDGPLVCQLVGHEVAIKVAIIQDALTALEFLISRLNLSKSERFNPFELLLWHLRAMVRNVMHAERVREVAIR